MSVLKFSGRGNTITDGDLMLEVNALKDKFCITFQLINKDRKPLDLFCEVLDQEKIPLQCIGTPYAVYAENQASMNTQCF